MRTQDQIAAVVSTAGTAAIFAAAGGFLTNLVTDNPERIERGATIAASIPVAFALTTAGVMALESDKPEED